MKNLRTTRAALVAITLCAGLLFGLADLGFAEDMGGGTAQLCEVTYVAEDGDEWVVSDCPVVEAGTTTLAGGIYAVTEDVTVEGELVVDGDVQLVIANDKMLFAPYGVRVKHGSKLKLYGQAGATGSLLVYGGIKSWTPEAVPVEGDMLVEGMEQAVPESLPQTGVGPESFVVAPTCNVIALDHEPAPDEVAELLESPALTPELLGSAYLWVFPAEVTPEEPAENVEEPVEEPAPAEELVDEDAPAQDQAEAEEPEVTAGDEPEAAAPAEEPVATEDPAEQAPEDVAQETEAVTTAQDADDQAADDQAAEDEEPAADDVAEAEEAEDAEVAASEDGALISREDEGDDANMVTVTFDANGGSGTMDPITVAPGQTFELPECGFEPPAGYTFSQWSLGNPGSNVSVPSSMTVRAWWTQAPEEEEEEEAPAATNNDAEDTSAPAAAPEPQDAAPAAAESTADDSTTSTSTTDAQTTTSQTTTSSSPQTGDPQGPLYSVAALLVAGVASLALAVEARRFQ